MDSINCKYCKKPITSKDNLLLGSHYFKKMAPYHIKCFDEAKKNVGFFSRPVMKVPPSRFNFFIGVNVLNIIIGLLIILSRSLLSIFPSSDYYYFIGLFMIMIGFGFVAGLLKYKKLK